MNKHAIPLPERFWSKVDVTDTGRCWNWRAAKNKDGYGMVLVDKKPERAHRIALFLRTGKMPLYACHTCDNPSCCNPDHIYSGSHSRNMTDKKNRRRGKAQCGENMWMATLTNKTAAIIREEYKSGNVSINELAKRHGSSYSVVQRIVSGKSYKETL